MFLFCFVLFCVFLGSVAFPALLLFVFRQRAWTYRFFCCGDFQLFAFSGRKREAGIATISLLFSIYLIGARDRKCSTGVSSLLVTTRLPFKQLHEDVLNHPHVAVDERSDKLCAISPAVCFLAQVVSTVEVHVRAIHAAFSSLSSSSSQHSAEGSAPLDAAKLAARHLACLHGLLGLLRALVLSYPWADVQKHYFSRATSADASNGIAHGTNVCASCQTIFFASDYKQSASAGACSRLRGELNWSCSWTLHRALASAVVRACSLALHVLLRIQNSDQEAAKANGPRSASHEGDTKEHAALGQQTSEPLSSSSCTPSLRVDCRGHVFLTENASSTPFVPANKDVVARESNVNGNEGDDMADDERAGASDDEDDGGADADKHDESSSAAFLPIASSSLRSVVSSCWLSLREICILFGTWLGSSSALNAVPISAEQAANSSTSSASSAQHDERHLPFTPPSYSAQIRSALYLFPWGDERDDFLESLCGPEGDEYDDACYESRLMRRALASLENTSITNTAAGDRLDESALSNASSAPARSTPPVPLFSRWAISQVGESLLAALLTCKHKGIQERSHHGNDLRLRVCVYHCMFLFLFDFFHMLLSFPYLACAAVFQLCETLVLGSHFFSTSKRSAFGGCINYSSAVPQSSSSPAAAAHVPIFFLPREWMFDLFAIICGAPLLPEPSAQGQLDRNVDATHASEVFLSIRAAGVLCASRFTEDTVSYSSPRQDFSSRTGLGRALRQLGGERDATTMWYVLTGAPSLALRFSSLYCCLLRALVLACRRYR